MKLIYTFIGLQSKQIRFTFIMWCFILGATQFSTAQSLTPQVLSTTGGFSTNQGISQSFTVGEMSMVQTFSAGGNMLTQGFQQSDANITALLDITNDEFGSFVVYPNPAVDNVSFGYQFPEEGHVSVELYNTLGQRLPDVLHDEYTTGKATEKISLDQYATGTYFLTIRFTSRRNGIEHTTSKMFQLLR